MARIVEWDHARGILLGEIVEVLATRRERHGDACILAKFGLPNRFDRRSKPLLKKYLQR